MVAKPYFGSVRIAKVEERAPRGLLVPAHHLPLRIRVIHFLTVDKMRDLSTEIVSNLVIGSGDVWTYAGPPGTMKSLEFRWAVCADESPVQLV